MVLTDTQSRTPSAGYGWSVLPAIAGVFFLFVSLYGSWLQSQGHSPVDAMNWPGDVAFAAIFVLLFAMRLIFWSRSPPALQAAVRTAFTALFGLTVILSAVAVVYALFVTHHGGPHAEPLFITCFTALAALCQIGSVIWLMRYRRE